MIVSCRVSKLLLPFLVVIPAANAQRIKEGCYDAYKDRLSCDPAGRMSNTSEFLSVLEDVCLTLVSDVFPTDEVTFNPIHHGDFLNAVEADSELCLSIQRAYPHCLFCAASLDASLRFSCQAGAEHTRCGGHAPMEDILAENPHLFPNGPQDLKDTCTGLQKAYQFPWIRDFNQSLPTTIDLCDRQPLVKHLCNDGFYCNGSCFDPVYNPPSCNYTGGILDPDLDVFTTCETINFLAFDQVDIGQVMTLDDHLDYLRTIDNNTKICTDARQAYHQCYWCQTERCFDPETWPTSCQAPDTIDPTIDIQRICQQLTYAFDDVAFEDEMNITRHKFRVPANLDFCDQARQVYHQCFWCAVNVPDDFCLPNTPCNSSVSLPEAFISHTLTSLGLSQEVVEKESELCLGIHKHWESHWEDPFSLPYCYEDIFLARLCPVEFCEAEAQAQSFEYLGATTTAQKRALIWMSRVAATLSFLGASYIIYDTLTDPQSRVLVYHQLLIGMAFFDIITAFGWVFATAPIDAQGTASLIEGAMGTEMTCKLQGFFIQLGFTSIFYNVSLSIYYVLVIAYDWREFHLGKIRRRMHLIPVLLGLLLAFIGIGQYGTMVYGCHLEPATEGNIWPILVLVVLPLGLSILVISACMLIVYCKVRDRANRSRQWSFGISQASRVEQAVFWQCVSYVLAFYITWPILFSVYLASVDEEGPLGLSLTVAFVAPLQGFNNFLVYIRPKLRIRRMKTPQASNLSGSSDGLQRKDHPHFSIQNMMRLLPSSNFFASSTADPSSRAFGLFDGGSRHMAGRDQPSAAIALGVTDSEDQAPGGVLLSAIPEGESGLENNSESRVSKFTIGGDSSSANDHSFSNIHELYSHISSNVMPGVEEEEEEDQERPTDKTDGSEGQSFPVSNTTGRAKISTDGETELFDSHENPTA